MNDEMIRVANKSFHAIVATMRKHAAHGAAWKKRTVEHHLKHARDHIDKFLGHDETEPHLDHAATRLAMALSVATILEVKS